MYRGEIWWANLPEPVGSEPGYRRPVLVIQDDAFIQSRISTVIVVILTSNIKLAEAPGNVFLPRELSGLPKDSVEFHSGSISPTTRNPVSFHPQIPSLCPGVSLWFKITEDGQKSG